LIFFNRNQGAQGLSKLAARILHKNPEALVTDHHRAYRWAVGAPDGV
jgi:hypothetical protein